MTQHVRRSNGSEAHEAISPRANRMSAEQVEVGLVLQEMLGTQAAARYLCTKAIPIDLAIRVLTRPWQRRWRQTVNTWRALRHRGPAGKQPNPHRY